MSGLHSHRHSHSHSDPNEHATKGNVIRWARFYNVFSDRLLKKSDPTILSLAGVKSGSAVLDVGCGPGSLTIAAKKQAGASGPVYGIDASSEMIEVARQEAQRAGLEVNFEPGLAEKLPFEDAKFEVVLSRLAFHHLPGELKTQATAEIYRVLKPGGVLLVVDFDPNTLPGPNFLKKWLTARTHGMMQVDVRDYIPILEANNFSRVESAPTGHRALAYVRGFKTI